MTEDTNMDSNPDTIRKMCDNGDEVWQAKRDKKLKELGLIDE